MAKSINVLLIEDSGFMRILISEILRNDSELNLVATAVNGKDGLEKIKALNPDVIVTDMMMPEYDGLYVVQKVMEGPAIPVILLSSLDRDDTQIFEALKAGAFDFIDKPQNNVGENRSQNYPLVSLIKAAAQAKTGRARTASVNFNPHTFETYQRYDVLAIGSSTGGPGAIESIIENLPSNLNIPVVVAQHMPERFIETFAERLNTKKIFPVKIADDGEKLRPGVVYLAPGHHNLEIVREHNHFSFAYTTKTFKEFNFPSVDCLFHSVAEIFGSRAIAVILTGMGKDGMQGMLRIKERGGFTIGQDESSSVVYGMPKAAFDAGAVKQVLTLPEIPGFIVSCLS